MSASILDDILAQNIHNITDDDLSEHEIKHIQAMITCGKGGSPAPPGKRWLYEVPFPNLPLLTSRSDTAKWRAEPQRCLAKSHHAKRDSGSAPGGLAASAGRALHQWLCPPTMHAVVACAGHI
jgi:hypothetical protein